MRLAIIAGLMAVRFLTACGGPEAPVERELAQQYVNCADCLHELRACMRWAGSNPESIELCQETHDACYAEMCGGLSASQENRGQVRTSGLPPDNICHVWCDVGPSAGYRTSAYAGSLAACFAFAQEVCGEAGTYTYNGQPMAF